MLMVLYGTLDASKEPLLLKEFKVKKLIKYVLSFHDNRGENLDLQ